MKKIYIILALAFASISLFAQEDSITTKEAKIKVQEIGLAFSNFDNFGLTYKIGNQKSLWRFYTLYFSGDNSKEETDNWNAKRNVYGFGIKAGKEFRKVIGSNLELRYGFDLLFDYSHEKSLGTSNNDDISTKGTSKTNHYSPGIGLVIGLNYVIKDKLVLGAELLPFFSYTTGKDTFTIYTTDSSTYEKTTKISGYSYGLSNSPVLLTVAYRF